MLFVGVGFRSPPKQTLASGVVTWVLLHTVPVGASHARSPKNRIRTLNPRLVDLQSLRRLGAWEDGPNYGVEGLGFSKTERHPEPHTAAFSMCSGFVALWLSMMILQPRETAVSGVPRS